MCGTGKCESICTSIRVEWLLCTVVLGNCAMGIHYSYEDVCHHKCVACKRTVTAVLGFDCAPFYALSALHSFLHLTTLGGLCLPTTMMMMMLMMALSVRMAVQLNYEES